ncbi:MAG: N-6 DNA methylase [Lentisphaeraceae bacterium]|nr:N-6 DNA methylase [Lentisphaeraceae bacterium]
MLGEKGAVVANLLDQEFSTKKSASLLGKTLHNTMDFAVVAQVYRDPAYETFRYVFLRDNVVVGTTAVSSRMVSSSSVMVDDKDDFIEDLLKRASSVRADSVYFLHNHPSGNPTPSLADIKVTKSLVQMFRDEGSDINFSGHVIINSTRFSIIDADGNTTENQLLESAPTYSIEKHREANSLFGHQVQCPEELAVVAKGVQKSAHTFQVVGMNIRNQVNLVLDGSYDLFENKNTHVVAALREWALASGSANFALVNFDVTKIDPRKRDQVIKNIQQSGAVFDIIDSEGLSLRMLGDFLPGKKSVLERRSFEVSEYFEEYSAEPNKPAKQQAIQLEFDFTTPAPAQSINKEMKNDSRDNSGQNRRTTDRTGRTNSDGVVGNSQPTPLSGTFSRGDSFFGSLFSQKNGVGTNEKVQHAAARPSAINDRQNGNSDKRDIRSGTGAERRSSGVLSSGGGTFTNLQGSLPTVIEYGKYEISAELERNLIGTVEGYINSQANTAGLDTDGISTRAHSVLDGADTGFSTPEKINAAYSETTIEKLRILQELFGVDARVIGQTEDGREKIIDILHPARRKHIGDNILVLQKHWPELKISTDIEKERLLQLATTLTHPTAMNVLLNHLKGERRRGQSFNEGLSSVLENINDNISFEPLAKFSSLKGLSIADLKDSHALFSSLEFSPKIEKEEEFALPEDIEGIDQRLTELQDIDGFTSASIHAPDLTPEHEEFNALRNHREVLSQDSSLGKDSPDPIEFPKSPVVDPESPVVDPELLSDVARLIKDDSSGEIRISHLQRVLAMNYSSVNSALQELVKQGVIGAAQGNGTYEILNSVNKPVNTPTIPEAGSKRTHELPEGTESVLVARLVKDTSDSMSDHFGHETIREVIIGFSSHKRNNFNEMRKHARNSSIPEIQALGESKDKSLEHRENYSMGAGYYLKSGHDDMSGWGVVKVSDHFTREEFLNRISGYEIDENILKVVKIEKSRQTKNPVSPSIEPEVKSVVEPISENDLREAARDFEIWRQMRESDERTVVGTVRRATVSAWLGINTPQFSDSKEIVYTYWQEHREDIHLAKRASEFLPNDTSTTEARLTLIQDELVILREQAERVLVEFEKMEPAVTPVIESAVTPVIESAVTPVIESAVTPSSVVDIAPVQAKKPAVRLNQNNHIITNPESLVPTGGITKIKANIKAIEVLQLVEEEGRQATKEEQEVLAHYVGWGGLKNIFERNIYRISPQIRDHAEKVKELLSEADWESAAHSTLNAHYTSPEIIEEMWTAARHLGFKGGNYLEPAGGIGHFIGLMPEDLAQKSRLHTVECDSVSSRIMAKLYPDAQNQAAFFEDAVLKNNNMDLIISNVPFLENPHRDPRYKKMHLHDYFFNRGIDVLKPGGVMIAITTSGSLDSSRSAESRRLLFEKADLVGAIRLPSDAFKKNSGAEVTTDILILRKKEQMESKGEDFRLVNKYTRSENISQKILGEREEIGLQIEDISERMKGSDNLVELNREMNDSLAELKDTDLFINEYFTRHPEMMLGELSLKRGRFGNRQEQSLVSTGDLQEALQKAFAQLPENILGKSAVQDATQAFNSTIADSSVKSYSFQIQDGVVVQNIDGYMVKVEGFKSPNMLKRAQDFIALRTAVIRTVNAQVNPDLDDSKVEDIRLALVEEFEDFEAKHGSPWKPAIQRQFRTDPEFPLVLSLQDQSTIIDNGKLRTVFEPTGLLIKRTAYALKEPSEAESLEDAYQISFAYKGAINIAYIARLLNKEEAEVKTEIIEKELAYIDPISGMIVDKAEYLSGNVRQKLEEAQNFLDVHPELKLNIEALQQAMPEEVGIDRIRFQLGSTWLPEKILNNWAVDKLPSKVEFSYNSTIGEWKLDGYVGNDPSYSTDRVDTEAILKASLNLRTVKVYDDIEGPNGSNKRVLNQKETAFALEKQKALGQSFVDFVKDSPEEYKKVEIEFNKTFNSFIVKEYQAPAIKFFPGASHSMVLREYQGRSVARGVHEPVLLAHAVGSGNYEGQIQKCKQICRLQL